MKREEDPSQELVTEDTAKLATVTCSLLQTRPLTVEKFDRVREVHVVLYDYITIVSYHCQGQEDNKMICSNVTRRPYCLPDPVDVLIGEFYDIRMTDVDSDGISSYKQKFKL